MAYTIETRIAATSAAEHRRAIKELYEETFPQAKSKKDDLPLFDPTKKEALRALSKTEPVPEPKPVATEPLPPIVTTDEGTDMSIEDQVRRIKPLYRRWPIGTRRFWLAIVLVHLHAKKYGGAVPSDQMKRWLKYTGKRGLSGLGATRCKYMRGLNEARERIGRTDFYIMRDDEPYEGARVDVIHGTKGHGWSLRARVSEFVFEAQRGEFTFDGLIAGIQAIGDPRDLITAAEAAEEQEKKKARAKRREQKDAA